MSNVTDRNVIDFITPEDRNLVAQKCPGLQSERLSRVRLQRAGL